jgi:hypothetical protein
MKMTFETWQQQNKHTLRALYEDFLLETGATLEELQKGKVANFSEFVKTMWENTVHA